MQIRLGARVGRPRSRSHLASGAGQHHTRSGSRTPRRIAPQTGNSTSARCCTKPLSTRSSSTRYYHLIRMSSGDGRISTSPHAAHSCLRQSAAQAEPSRVRRTIRSLYIEGKESTAARGRILRRKDRSAREPTGKLGDLDERMLRSDSRAGALDVEAGVLVVVHQPPSKVDGFLLGQVA